MSDYNRTFHPKNSDIETRAYYYSKNGYGDDSDANYNRAKCVEYILGNFRRYLPEYKYLKDHQKNRVAFKNEYRNPINECETCHKHTGNYVLYKNEYENTTPLMCDNCLVSFARSRGVVLS